MTIRAIIRIIISAEDYDMNVTLAFELFWEFFKIGLFAVGGGPATLPFLIELAEKKPWFSVEELTNMIALSEATPGPLGVNMATYAGFKTLGIPGGIIATAGLALPSVVIIIMIAKFLSNFSSNKYVQAAFGGIRPAVTALIGCAVLSLIQVSLFVEKDGLRTPAYGSIAVAVLAFALMQFKRLNRFHPALWFVFGAAAGIIFRL